VSGGGQFEQEIDQALQHHRAGRLAEAEAIYRQILQVNPNHVDALHLLGVLAHQAGHHDVASQLISQAIQRGAGAEAYNNLGNVLKLQGNIANAAAAFGQAIKLSPNYAEPYTNLGLLLDQSGRFEDALKHHRKALEINPNLADARHNLAMTLDHLGRYDQAIAEWERALDLQPDHLHALNNFGLALTRTGGLDRAVALLRRYVQLQPSDPEGYANLSTALVKAQRTDEALAAAKKAIELAPARAEGYSNLGSLYQKLGRLDDAVQEFERALQIDPEFGLAHGNLGSAYEQLDRYDEAAVEFEKAAQLMPNYLLVFNTLSALYRSMNRDADSLHAADRALQIEPNHPDGHGNRAFALLSMGRLVEGFEEYEWRWRCLNFTTAPREFDRPMWDGSDPAGRSILVHTEQGYGDVLQMVRYLPMLAQRGARIILECAPPLKTLLDSVQGVDRVIVAGLKLPDFDLHCPIMSLPRAFGTTLETIPNQVPYLVAPEARRALWWPKVDEIAAGRLKVGIIWGGNAKPDPRRSCDLPHLAALWDVPGVSYISLQTGAPATQLKELQPGFEIVHLGDQLKDFADTAAIMERLDLIITIDTAAAHLAGALGKRTWLMLPFSPDWRWLRDREDSPWYPTMRLFRQLSRGDWKSVAAQITRELRSLAGSAGASRGDR
jgi:tetratricopeptide (TPR) repeat protein